MGLGCHEEAVRACVMPWLMPKIDDALVIPDIDGELAYQVKGGEEG